MIRRLMGPISSSRVLYISSYTIRRQLGPAGWGKIIDLKLVHEDADKVHEVHKLRGLEVGEHACHERWYEVCDVRTHRRHDPRKSKPSLP
jgi:hypothetical protein